MRWLTLMLLFAATLHAEPLEVNSPKDLLAMHGIDSSQLERFRDNEPLGSDDEESLIRILQRMPRFPKEKFQTWSLPAPPPNELAKSPSEHRTEIHRLSGRAVRIERVALLPEVARRIEFDSYYRVTLQPDDQASSAVVCTREIPSAWEGREELDQPATAVGIFLKSAGNVGERPQFIYAADRVAWFPDRTDESLGVTPSLVQLAGLGFDVGLLDAARRQNNKPLSLADRDCFYALLSAVGRADQAAFAKQAGKPMDIVELLRDTKQHHGELLQLRGIARRATLVRVSDPDVHQRFGIDHYYQIDLFVDLDKQVIKFAKKPGEEMPIYENSYPVTVCVPSLPPNLPEGELVRENVVVHAAFLKLWTYSSEYVTSFDKRLRQLSPMFIGTEPQIEAMPTINPGFGIGLATLVLLSLGGIWFGLRWTSSPSRAATLRPTVRSKLGVPGDRDPPTDSERPDFSGLDQAERRAGPF